MLAIYSDVTVAEMSVTFRRTPPPSVTGMSVRFGTADVAAENLVDDLLGPLILIAATLHHDRDEEIIAQGARAENCFQVVSGCVRTVRLLEDGRRQVGEFLFAGDVFGWDAVEEHEFAAEAVTPVTLRRLRLSVVEAHADGDRAFARRLRRYTADQVRLARSRLVLLGRKTASERVASFLLEMCARLDRPSLTHLNLAHLNLARPNLARPGVTCSSNTVIELPMSRADMADYLGLTIETICRGLSELRRRGTIVVARTRVAIQDPNALALAGADRMK